MIACPLFLKVRKKSTYRIHGFLFYFAYSGGMFQGVYYISGKIKGVDGPMVIMFKKPDRL